MSRPITLRPNERFVPLTHVKTNLRTMGKTLAEFRAWLDER